MEKTNLNIDDLKTKINDAANMLNGIEESNGGLDTVVFKFGIARPDKDSDRLLFIDFQCKGKKGTSGSFNVNTPFTTEDEKKLMHTLGLLSKAVETSTKKRMSIGDCQTKAEDPVKADECEKKTTEDPGFPAKWKACRLFGDLALISESITEQEILAAQRHKKHLYLLTTKNGCDQFLANFENLPLGIGERIVVPVTNNDLVFSNRMRFLDPELFDFQEECEPYTKHIWEVSSLNKEEEGLLGYEPTKECGKCIHKACPKKADYAAALKYLYEATNSASGFCVMDAKEVCWCPNYDPLT